MTIIVGILHKTLNECNSNLRDSEQRTNSQQPEITAIHRIEKKVKFRFCLSFLQDEKQYPSPTFKVRISFDYHILIEQLVNFSQQSFILMCACVRTNSKRISSVIYLCG